MTQKVGMARYYAVIALVIALDQITKFAVEAKYAVHQFEPVTSFFNLGLTYNPGAAFSFLADHDGWQRWFFIAVSILVVVPITLTSLFKHIEPLERLVGALIVAGGTGNLIDRMSTGAVTDFLDVHWRGLHWPAFNLADVFIVMAVIGGGVLSLQPSFTKTRSEP